MFKSCAFALVLLNAVCFNPLNAMESSEKLNDNSPQGTNGRICYVQTPEEELPLDQLIQNYHKSKQKNEGTITGYGLYQFMEAAKNSVLGEKSGTEKVYFLHKSLLSEPTENLTLYSALANIMKLLNEETENFVASLLANPNYPKLINYKPIEGVEFEENKKQAKEKLQKAAELVSFEDHIDSIGKKIREGNIKKAEEDKHNLKESLEYLYFRADQFALAWDQFLKIEPLASYNPEKLSEAFETLFADDLDRDFIIQQMGNPSKDRLINALGMRIELIKNSAQIFHISEDVKNPTLVKKSASLFSAQDFVKCCVEMFHKEDTKNSNLVMQPLSQSLSIEELVKNYFQAEEKGLGKVTVDEINQLIQAFKICTLDNNGDQEKLASLYKAIFQKEPKDMTVMNSEIKDFLDKKTEEFVVNWTVNKEDYETNIAILRGAEFHGSKQNFFENNPNKLDNVKLVFTTALMGNMDLARNKKQEILKKAADLYNDIDRQCSEGVKLKKAELSPEEFIKFSEKALVNSIGYKLGTINIGLKVMLLLKSL